MHRSREEPPEEFQRLLEAFEKAAEDNDAEEMEALGIQGLLMAAEWAEGQEDEGLRLQQEAHEHAEAADWAQAEACCRRVLELAESEGNPMSRYKAHSDLSSLYDLVGQTDRAWAEAQSALEAARQSEIGPLIVPALATVAYYRLDHGDLDGAIGVAEEALAFCAAEPMFDMLNARSLILRARCLIALGDYGAAHRDLAAAWPLVEPYQEALFMAGCQGSLAGWWTAMAHLRECEGNGTDAVEAMGKAVSFRRTISRLPQLEGPYARNRLAESLHRYASLLASAGREPEAQAATEESRSLRAAIGLAPL